VKRLLPLVASLALSGCLFRLSDPVYAFQRLEAEEPPGPEYSLLLVTVRSDPGLLGTPEFFSLWFRRVDPNGKTAPSVGASSQKWFRAFRPRTVKDGNFLILAPPGVYELRTMLDSGFLGQEQIWHVSGDAGVASRIHITRPGIYDLGTLRVTAQSLMQSATLVSMGDAFSPERVALLRDAVRGTSWEKVMNQPPKKKRGAGDTTVTALPAEDGDRT